MIGARCIMGAAGSAGGDGIAAKSVVFDCADNWGDASWIGIRSAEFVSDGEVISLGSSDFTAYGTGYDSTHGLPEFIFDTFLSKTGTWGLLQWLEEVVASTRVVVVFNTSRTFDSIIMNNSHNNGETTTRGAKNVKITASTDEITNTTYNASVSNGTVIFNGQFAEHVESDAADDQELTLTL